MSTPKRIQRKRTKGWRMPENCLYVGRPSKWGNPFYVNGYFRIGKGWLWCQSYVGAEGGRFTLLKTKEECVEWFRKMIDANQDTWRKKLEALRGHDLACWCKIGETCHADVLLELANREAGR